jgi:DNA replicative helicase MCM subunit Mcm2 (Cdc46/Mcm family)
VFTYIEGSRVCRDCASYLNFYKFFHLFLILTFVSDQEIKIQEQVQKLTMGVIPRSILAVLQDDLVDSCLAGDDIVRQFI